MTMEPPWPRTPLQWREALAQGLRLSPKEAGRAYAADHFPYDEAGEWIRRTYGPENGYAPEFVPALLRNLRGLVAWTYGDMPEPHWPGSDADRA